MQRAVSRTCSAFSALVLLTMSNSQNVALQTILVPPLPFVHAHPLSRSSPPGLPTDSPLSDVDARCRIMGSVVLEDVIWNGRPTAGSDEW
jgi:hypothetical protein